ncbi:MAG: NYN domain-containing protein, partial [Clostridia bacterium]|nr:NYN domain-containing protein [Clostridia bacterium]
MFFDFLIRKKKPAVTKEKPKAVAFVDFEHWYIALDNLYHIRPDIKGWRDELNAKYDLQEIVVFADFSNPSLRAEIAHIREVTNVIIETQNSSPHITKDFTDFIMLDHIYQKTVSRPDIDVYVIFTGDGHFSSAVSFIMNRLNKPVVIYAVRDALSQQLRNTASEVFEVPAVGVSERRGLFSRGGRQPRASAAKPASDKKASEKPSNGGRSAGRQKKQQEKASASKQEAVTAKKPEKADKEKKTDDKKSKAGEKKPAIKSEQPQKQEKEAGIKPASDRKADKKAEARSESDSQKKAAKPEKPEKKQEPKESKEANKEKKAQQSKKAASAPEKPQPEKASAEADKASAAPAESAPSKAGRASKISSDPEKQPEKTSERKSRKDSSAEKRQAEEKSHPSDMPQPIEAAEPAEAAAIAETSRPEATKPEATKPERQERAARPAKKSQADVVSDIIEKINREKAAAPEAEKKPEEEKPVIATQSVVTDGSVSIAGAYASSLPPMPTIAVAAAAEKLLEPDMAAE